MLFNSFTYLLFLPLVVLLYWFLPRSFGKTLLLVASYIFYMHWMPAYGLLILALTAVNYGLGLGIAGRPDGKKESLLLWGLVFNLGCLCFFKYANFLVDSFWQIFKLVVIQQVTRGLSKGFGGGRTARAATTVKPAAKVGWPTK